MTMTAPTGPAPRSGLGLLARILTEVFAPAVLAAVMPIAIALHVTGSWAAGLAWAAVTVLFCSALPFAVIVVGVRRGRLTDHHIRVREQRSRVMAIGLTSIITGVALLMLLGAPRELVASAVAMLAVVLVLSAVNLHWKLSAHAAVATGSVSMLVLVFGSTLLVAFPIAAAVAWSRVRLTDHTVAQVIAGGLTGILVTVPTFALLS